jgi:outer membrane receptor for ferrienterochelin and colicins
LEGRMINCSAMRMKVLFSCIILVSQVLVANAQHSFRATVQDKANLDQLSGVTIMLKGNNQKGTLTDENGFAELKNLPPGNMTIQFSFVGYLSYELTIKLPDTSIHSVLLQPDARALSSVVIVSSTRGNERIENATTKVEVLGPAEMNEESTLKPGNIASILGDVSGVQIQQSSATSGNVNVRIQGLDGKYTQILQDGMPLYGGYSGGFGILSIPPLDLRQVELIKGSSSTLYGGGAIGGLVNLISKRPGTDPDASFLINQTTLKETNLNAYYSQRWKKIGFTMFAGQTFQKEVDVNKDGFSDVPNIKSTLIHPTLFFYPSTKTWFSLGGSTSIDDRLGGDMIAIDSKPDAVHPYFEKNLLHRNTLSFLSESRIDNTLTINMKGSYSNFERNENTNTYVFDGNQENYFGELSFLKRIKKHQVVAGVNITGDVFKPSAKTPAPVGSFSDNILGVFAQDTWRIFGNTKLETGLRFDHHNKYGDFLLPRIAVFQRFDEHWGGRAGFGMGYITPNPLTPQTKDYDIYQLQPIAPGVKAEQSYAGNLEVNYKKDIGEEGSLFINQAFFITSIKDPIIGTEDSIGNVFFTNQGSYLLTKGIDTYVQLQLPRWEFYIGYTYTDAIREYLPSNQFVLYTPKNRAATTALYEITGKWRAGIEASYTGYQHRDDFSKTPGYLFMAAMVEKKFGPKWSLVLNCENILDERQSRHESLYTGPVTDPDFKTLWGPIDGRAFNLCLRFQPFAKAE